MKTALSFLFVILISFCGLSQQLLVKGKITDKTSGEPLSFANVRVSGSTLGTAANREGEYELRIVNKEIKLIASYIGYRSDTLSLRFENDLTRINFTLEKINLDLPEVVIMPGENPALEIIRKAILKKKQRSEYLDSYIFDAYTKGLVRTNQELQAGDGFLSIGVGTDTSAMIIGGILENQSRGYFKKPNNYKEIIIARKQSANFPPTLNVLTGGRLIQNFYNDDIRFFGRELPGPLADNALSYYFFYIENAVAQDNDTIFQIYMTPDNSSDPGFEGRVFINSSSYDLIKVDVNLNRAANTGGIFDTVNVFQQFTLFDNNVYMPVDYRLFVKANIIGLVRVGFELNSILYDYEINPEIKTAFFDKAILTVLPEADKKDSLYWLNVQTIPSTDEELDAYTRIDSVSNLPFSFWDEFSILSTRINFMRSLSVSAPIAMYHFNRVEGHAVDFGIFLNDALDRRLNTSINFSYGFSDKKFKTNLSSTYLFGDYRTYSLKVNAYNNINTLFGESENYNELTSTVLSLLSKYEFRDYYYSKGFGLELSGEVFPVLKLSAGFINHTDNSAYNESDFSFFKKDRTYRTNPPIYETRVNALNFGFRLDLRDYIEDGFFRRRVGQNRSYILFDGDVLHSSKNLTGSGIDFTKYSLTASGRLNTFRSAYLGFRVKGIYNNGYLPYQLLNSLPGNIELTSRSYSFRTLNVNEVFGDRTVTVHLDHFFGDELFRMLRVPVLKDIELQLNTFVNAAYSDVSDKSASILPSGIKTLKQVFYEAGFGIGHVLFPIRFEFSWKLNQRNGNNFRFGMNAFIF